RMRIFLFFFNDTATTEIYTLSLHDALPISHKHTHTHTHICTRTLSEVLKVRSEEHTSELQSHLNLVCRLLLGKTTHPQDKLHAARHTPIDCSRHLSRATT